MYNFLKIVCDKVKIKLDFQSFKKFKNSCRNIKENENLNEILK